MHQNNKYWMKRKRYGWGWTPTTWQGWTLIVLQMGIVLIAATGLPSKPAHPTKAELLRFFTILVLAVITLVLVSMSTAPTPHWRWGKKPTDNKNEDF